jgi:trimeric autotransporter adhesin
MTKTGRLCAAGLWSFFLVFVFHLAQAQGPGSFKWQSKQPFEQRTFVRNVGQYSAEEAELGERIYFACRTQSYEVFFTAHGFTHKFLVKKYKESEEEGRVEENDSPAAEMEREKRALATEPHYLRSTWEGGSEAAVFGAEGQSGFRHSFVLPGTQKSVHAPGYEKVVLRELYPGVDVVFTMPEEGGFRYDLHVKAGADISRISLKQKGVDKLTFTEKGLLSTLKGGLELLSHAPVAYYSDGGKIDAWYELNGASATFGLAAYDHTKDIVIDPWIVNPNYTGWNRAYDVARDNSGNIYAYGGPVPYFMNKYDPSGNLLWTFTTPYSSELYGDFAVDQAGNCIIVEGFSGGRVIKIDANANLTFSVVPSTTGYAEYWRIGYNCDYTVLRTSGYITASDGLLHQMVDLDPNTGSMLGTSGAVNYESRALFIDRSGFIYSLSPTQFAGQPNYVTKFTPGLGLVYAVNSGYTISEGTGGYQNSNYFGCGSCFSNMNGVTADNVNVYTYDGRTLYKRRNANGQAIDSLVLANGSTLLNGGIILDPCNDLYVGTQNSVIKFDTNFTVLATVGTPGPVYDLCFSINNNIVAAGDGFVTELAFNTNCKLLIATAGDSACVGTATGSATVTVTPQAGDTPPYSFQWSNGATTSSITGLAPGTYYVVVRDNSCGTPKVATDSVIIPAKPLPIVAVNSDSICAGQQTASLLAGGAATYTWAPATGLNTTTGAAVTANPPSSQVYTVTGTSSGGCVNTTTLSVSVFQPPIVSVTSSSACPGGTATVTAQGAGTYTWSSGTTGTSLSDAPATTTSYTVTGSDAIGCFDTAVATISVAPAFSIGVNSGGICAGQQTLTLNASGAGSYTWSPAAGLSGTTGTSVGASPSVNTTYTITGSVGSCTAEATTLVSVYPLPTVTVNSGSICVTGSLTLTGGGATSYTWLPAGGLSGTSGSVVTAAPLISTNYTVAGSDNNGCFGAAIASVTVNPLPIVTATSASLCAGGSATLSAGGAQSYSWDPPAGLSATTGGSVTATPAATSSYTVTGTDASGCRNSTAATVTVAPLPNVTASGTVICIGSSGTISAAGANTFAWSPTSGLSSASGASVTASPAVTIQYTVTGTDAFGCSDTAVATVMVNPLPQVSFTPLMSSGCAPLCVTFNNTSASAGALLWNFGDGASSAAAGLVYCYSLSGTYSPTLTLTDGNGCVSYTPGSVIVYPQPQPDFYVDPQPASVFDPQVQFYDASTGAVINSWQWTFGVPGAASQAQNPGYTYPDAGQYEVWLTTTSDYGCMDSVLKIVTIDPEFVIYVPNAFTPNYDGTNDVFMAKGEGIKDFRLFVFDRWGMKVFESEQLGSGWDGTLRGEAVQEDVYVWKIELKTWKNESKIFRGTVSLLR